MKEAIKTGYLPRKHQNLLHGNLKRFNVLVCHRRFGKTVFSLNEMIDQAARNGRRNPQYAYVAPTYGQAKRVAWDMFKEFTANMPGVTVNEADLRIDVKHPVVGRIRFMLLGAEKPGSLRGIYLDGVILDEYAECDPTIWSQVIRPALSDREGWAIFIGTPKGLNHFHEIYQSANKNMLEVEQSDWYTAMFKASETGVIPITELEAARMTMSEEEYDQEYECSFAAALVGAYYGKHMNTLEEKDQITSVPYDPAVPVDTYWDLGIGDSTTVWFIQEVGREFHIIDYLEDSGQGLEHYAKVILEKPYAYRDHVLPHDGAARELGTGKSRQETLKSHGLKTIILPRHKLEDGINACRLVLPKCWFDLVKTERGINCLKNYERKWDAKNQIFSSRPLHNWASHGADGFRTFAMGVKENRTRTENRNLPRMADDYDYDIFGVS